MNIGFTVDPRSTLILGTKELKSSDSEKSLSLHGYELINLSEYRIHSGSKIYIDFKNQRVKSSDS